MSQTSADPPALFAAREPIFPRRVHGRFRTLKWWIMGVTLAIYYITPWIRWDRGPALPDQAVLVDLANRRFYFFFIEIWPQEFYFVAGLLIMAGLGLFLFTSALGRVWCGYTCPQTVWTDLFILVERWIEGDRNARVRLWNAPWTATKVRLRAVKWSVWLLIALATGGAWVFYFADAPTLLRQLLTFSAPPVTYFTDRHPDRHHLHLRRLHARAGLHLHVPLAAHPGGDDGRGDADRRLPRLARRAARQAPQGRGRRRASATASTATPASTSARWASTSATARSSPASPARSASTPATR